MFAPVVVESLFEPEACARLRAIAAASAPQTAALVGGLRAGEIRRAEIAWLDHEGETAFAFERCLRAIADANREAFAFELEDFLEPMQTARYEAAVAGHFDWHMDVGDGPIARRRKLTLVVQLSHPSGYEGGRLEVNVDGRARVMPTSLGAAAVFPSFALHRVAPVERGERWSLTLWAHGPTFR